MHRIAWPYMALAFALAFVFLFLMLAFVLFLMFALLFLHSLAELETCANDGVVEIKNLGFLVAGLGFGRCVWRKSTFCYGESK